MKFYIHKVTVKYYDYGSFLDTSIRLGWSDDNKNVFSVTDCLKGFDAAFAEKLKIAEESNGLVEVVRGRDITRKHDLNPRGDI